jgi:hypothetical protein
VFDHSFPNVYFEKPKNFKFNELYSFKEGLKEGDKVYNVLKLIQRRLLVICKNGLCDVIDWCKLYIFLSKKHGLSAILPETKRLMPRTFCDLVYKTKLLFQSLHKLRFAMIEGQKRVYSSTMVLMGHLPDPAFKCHLSLSHEEYRVQGIKNLDANSSWSVMVKEANRLLKKFKFKLSPNMTEVCRDDEGLSSQVTAVYREHSRRMAESNSNAQPRGWKTVMTDFLNNEELANVCVPYELDPKNKPHPDGIGNKHYIREYREYFLRRILVDKAAPDIAKSWGPFTELIQKKDIKKIISQFIVGAKRSLTDTFMDMEYMGDAGLPIVLMVMVTVLATNMVEANTLKTVLNSSGKQSSNYIYREVFSKKEEDVVPFPDEYHPEVRKNYDSSWGGSFSNLYSIKRISFYRVHYRNF